MTVVFGTRLPLWKSSTLVSIVTGFVFATSAVGVPRHAEVRRADLDPVVARDLVVRLERRGRPVEPDVLGRRVGDGATSVITTRGREGDEAREPEE